MKFHILTSLLLLGTWQLTAPAPALAQEQPDAQPSGAAPNDGADSAAPAKALTPREARRKARALEQEFQSLFQKESYDQAAEVLTQIIELDPDEPQHVYNLGLVHYHRGDKEQALDTFERFLATDSRDRTLKREARRFVHILSRDVEIIRNARAQAEAKSRAAESEAAAAQQALQKAEQELAEARAELEAARLAQAKSEAEHEQLREIVMRAPVGAGARKRTIGVSLALVGGLALGAGAFYGLDAMNANSEAESVEQWTVGHDWLIDRADSYNTRSLIFSLAGVGLIAGGATLYYLGEREAQTPLLERVGVDVAPSVGPDGAGVTLSGQF